MAVTSTYETVATHLKAVIDTEFAPEGFTAILDKLHESLGRKRVDIGIAPVRERRYARDAYVRETWIEVRFYDLWTQEISPDTLVNPVRIATFAERFSRAIEAYNNTVVGTGSMWFFDVEEIDYPDDPTGNKTRFHASVRAYGNNPAIVETVG